MWLTERSAICKQKNINISEHPAALLTSTRFSEWKHKRKPASSFLEITQAYFFFSKVLQPLSFVISEVIKKGEHCASYKAGMNTESTE